MEWFQSGSFLFTSFLSIPPTAPRSESWFQNPHDTFFVTPSVLSNNNNNNNNIYIYIYIYIYMYIVIIFSLFNAYKILLSRNLWSNDFTERKTKHYFLSCYKRPNPVLNTNMGWIKERMRNILLRPYNEVNDIQEKGSVLFDLWYINYRWLFNGKSIFIHLNSSISNNSVLHTYTVIQHVYKCGYKYSGDSVVLVRTFINFWTFFDTRRERQFLKVFCIIHC